MAKANKAKVSPATSNPNFDAAIDALQSVRRFVEKGMAHGLVETPHEKIDLENSLELIAATLGE